MPLAELSFREAANRSGDWPWPEFLKAEDFEEALITHREVLKNSAIGGDETSPGLTLR